MLRILRDETNRINIEYEAAQHHLVFATQGDTVFKAHVVQEEERALYYRREAGTLQAARSFPNTGYIVFIQTEM